MDIVAGSDLTGKKSRDNYFIGEAYLTYYVEWTDGKKYPIEIVVWIAPNGGAILFKHVIRVSTKGIFLQQALGLIIVIVNPDDIRGNGLPSIVSNTGSGRIEGFG